MFLMEALLVPVPRLGCSAPLPQPPSPGPVDALRVGGAVCERWTEL